jgi:two-component system response regulator HydG
MVDTVQNPIRRTTNQPVTGLKSMQELQEKDMIIRTLEAVKFNKSKAARILKIDRKTLYLKIEKYGIK